MNLHGNMKSPCNRLNIIYVDMFFLFSLSLVVAGSPVLGHRPGTVHFPSYPPRHSPSIFSKLMTSSSTTCRYECIKDVKNVFILQAGVKATEVLVTRSERKLYRNFWPSTTSIWFAALIRWSKTGTNSSPKDSWWRFFRRLTIAVSSITREQWWLSTIPSCAHSKF